MRIVPVILSGGSGSRLWPLSRKRFPKQYLPLINSEYTLLQSTIQRLSGIKYLSDPVFVCNQQHRFVTAQQLNDIGIKQYSILLEPVGRNTAPAIAAAAQFISDKRSSPCDLMLVLPADHAIQDIDQFHHAITIASKIAANGKLVTFGITPTKPHAGYGYIKSDGNRNLTNSDTVPQSFPVLEFIEKPQQETAERYIQEGVYYWNSGMFLFRADQLLNELNLHNPNIIEAITNAVKLSTEDIDFVRLDEQSFARSPSDSIDYALMEKSDNVVVVPLDAGWSDIGSWSALFELGNKDHNGNCINGDVIYDEVTNCYINADHHLVAAIGVEDLIIVDTPDATLVTSMDKSQDVKKIVDKLQKKNHNLTDTHRKVYRPWGWYDAIDIESRFQVKRICVNPGASLSLQKHYHRSEHWVVVKGSARVTNGDTVMELHENQSTYIPIGAIHRLENPGRLPLHIIEVQSGDYLGEDDIERMEDDYGR
jgi:mannose-1-phosphate guanylyltransferase/mannose-6-phosphate isomerase